MKTNLTLILIAPLLFIGCSSTPVNNTFAPPTASGSSQRNALSPKHFWFDYPFQPSPGKRYWTLVDEQTWMEHYESGDDSRFKVVGRTTVGETSGTLVVKISGDPQKTDTGNEGNFQAFIPDVGSAKMEFSFRNKTGGEWQEWRSLAEMQGIE